MEVIIAARRAAQTVFMFQPHTLSEQQPNLLKKERKGGGELAVSADAETPLGPRVSATVTSGTQPSPCLPTPRSPVLHARPAGHLHVWPRGVGRWGCTRVPAPRTTWACGHVPDPRGLPSRTSTGIPTPQLYCWDKSARAGGHTPFNVLNTQCNCSRLEGPPRGARPSRCTWLQPPWSPGHVCVHGLARGHREGLGGWVTACHRRGCAQHRRVTPVRVRHAPRGCKGHGRPVTSRRPPHTRTTADELKK